MNGRLGKYELLDELGAGGMAVVYRAHDTTLSRTVALKVINQRLQSGEGARRRFLNEARVAAALSHPNIISIYELGIEDGFPFIAMEYLPGRDLRDLLDERETLTIRQKVSIALQIGRALQHAHGRGVIHRDVKPANIRVLDNGVVKLMDFGIAKFLEEETSRLTRTGAVVGSTPYLSPEQLQGDEPSEASDAFAFGIVMYELLTYTRPFSAANPAAMVYRILHVEAPAISDESVPEKLKRLVSSCLKKPVEQRLTSFVSIVYQLQTIRDELRNAGASAGSWSEEALTDGVIGETDPGFLHGPGLLGLPAPGEPTKRMAEAREPKTDSGELVRRLPVEPTGEGERRRSLVVSVLVFVLGGLSALVLGLGVVWLDRRPNGALVSGRTPVPTQAALASPPTEAPTAVEPTVPLPLPAAASPTASATPSQIVPASATATASLTRPPSPSRTPSQTATSKKATSTATERAKRSPTQPEPTSPPPPTETSRPTPRPSATISPTVQPSPTEPVEPTERRLLEQGKPRGNELEHYERAKSQMEKQRWAEAIQNLQRAIAENPEPGYLMEGMFLVKYLPQLLLAEAYAKLGDVRMARLYLREAKRYRLEGLDARDLANVEKLLEER